tara:strand:+ start:765 stop:1373 length:609 start_codon:yes stop_codon:yes gene_type:complete
MKSVLVGTNKTLILITLFVISSCSLATDFRGFNYGQFFLNSDKSFIHVQGNFVNDEKIKIKFQNREYNASLKVEDDVKVNLDFEDIKLLLFMGKIIRTYGLDNNFEIISYEPFQNLLSFSKFDSTALIRLSNPETHYMQIDFTYKKLDANYKNIFASEGIDKDIYLLEESFYVPQIRWKGTNYYLLDSNNNILESKQTIFLH